MLLSLLRDLLEILCANFVKFAFLSNVSMQNLLEKSQESGLPQLNINSHIKKKIGQTARVQCNRTRQMYNHYPKQTWIKQNFYSLASHTKTMLKVNI